MQPLDRRAFLAATAALGSVLIATRWTRRRGSDMADALPSWYRPDDMIAVYQYLSDQDFPTVEQLRQGILLGCIAHALWLAANEGEFAFDKYWDGDTYIDDNGQGERWAVSFADAGAVAVFYTNETPRNPYPKGSPPYDQVSYFRGMPDHLQPAKERALAYMPDFDFVLGGPNAVITAAMWADGERFTAADPWDAVFEHSAEACYQQILPLEVALVEWKWYEDLSNDQVTVLRSLYERKLASPDAAITVEPWERASMRADRAGLAAARESLAAVGIALP